MRIEDMNWMDVEEYLKHENRLMLVLGACEQHGYLSLLTDTKIPLALADAASQQTGVLVAPPLSFGCSPYFLTYPGTLSFRATTLMSAVEDIIRSLYGQCFRRILILNGHGGNSPGRSKLREIVNEIPELQVVWYDWWELPAIEMIAQKMDIKPNHANWLEAFPFTIVSELPEGEKNPPRLPSIASAELSRKFLRDGSFGGQYRVEDSIMQEIFNAVLQDILEILKFEQEIP